jgi:hypothetical protein
VDARDLGPGIRALTVADLLSGGKAQRIPPMTMADYALLIHPTALQPVE